VVESLKEVAMRVFRRDDYIYIITDEKELTDWRGNSSVCIIPISVFEYVEKFVEGIKPQLDGLMRSERPGTNYYWEVNYHDKLCNLLSDACKEHEYVYISNSLCALGY
jgi:hypothetical protein